MGISQADHDIAEGYEAGWKAAIEQVAKLAEAWEKPSFALMRAGEMKAQELRTVIAVAGAIARGIRALGQA